MNSPAAAVAAPSWRETFGIGRPTLDEADSVKYAQWILSFKFRPWDWVMACYPWGVSDSPLEGRVPELWQREWLKMLQKELQRRDMSLHELANRVIRLSTAAGNGVGKTCLVAWVIHWFVSCYPNGEAVITASTEGQLSNKTWRELRKWQDLAINGWQFEWTATKYRHREFPETWHAVATPWSESNPQAFAGTHEKYVLIIFDEASGIADSIWDVIEGAMTTGLVLFLAFGNPSENSGGFFDTHCGKTASLWLKLRVDAREVTFANKKEIQGWIDTYGADSDFCKVHIYGQFPSQTATSFISSELVRKAADNAIEWRYIPRIVPRLMGVDLARGGKDLSVCLRRIGRKVHPDIQRWSERDSTISADFIARQINEWQPDLVFIDGVGLGGPVIDYLRRRGYGRIIVDVQNGATPNDPEDAKRYANMRTANWARMREWLHTADIPPVPSLLEELVAPRFRFHLRSDRMLLEPKAEMAARGVNSPNDADALANTFWFVTPTAGGVGYGSAEPDAV